MIQSDSKHLFWNDTRLRNDSKHLLRGKCFGVTTEQVFGVIPESGITPGRCLESGVTPGRCLESGVTPVLDLHPRTQKRS